MCCLFCYGKGFFVKPHPVPSPLGEGCLCGANVIIFVSGSLMSKLYRLLLGTV